jgi:hypothetical protein
MDEDGASFVDDVTAGDVWFFPAGVPHSLQALDEGCEFLLVFDSGDFSEENTFLATEMMLRSPKEVWAKDLQVDVSALDYIPQDQKYVRDAPFRANICMCAWRAAHSLSSKACAWSRSREL